MFEKLSPCCQSLPSLLSFHFKHTLLNKKILLVSVLPTSCTVGFLFSTNLKKRWKKTQTAVKIHSSFTVNLCRKGGYILRCFICKIWGGWKNRGAMGAVTNINAPDITCNHRDIHLRTNSSLWHHLNDLSCSERLKKISVIRHLRTAGRKCQPRGKLNLIAICAYKENQGI